MHSGRRDIPPYLEFAIRLGTPPKDWGRLLDDAEERYRDYLTEGGREAAERYARREAFWFYVEAAKRCVKPAAMLAALQRFIH